jgi:hypothetical protein
VLQPLQAFVRHRGQPAGPQLLAGVRHALGATEQHAQLIVDRVEGDAVP